MAIEAVVKGVRRAKRLVIVHQAGMMGGTEERFLRRLGRGFC